MYERKFNQALQKLMESSKLTSIDTEAIDQEDGIFLHLPKIKEENRINPLAALYFSDTNWREFLNISQQIFDYKINHKILLDEIHNFAMSMLRFPINFSLKMIDAKVAKTYQNLIRHASTRGKALIPIYNIILQDVEKISLASSTLYAGRPDSLFATQLRLLHFSHAVSEDLNYLEIDVSGDSSSQKRQIAKEKLNALMLLRYVSLGYDRTNERYERITEFPSIHVQSQPVTNNFHLVKNIDSLSSSPAWSISRPVDLIFDQSMLDNAIRRFQLEDFNSHFANEDQNQFSARIISAMNYYDQGLRSNSSVQSMVNFVISVNIAIPTSGSRGEDISLFVKKLILYVKNSTMLTDHVSVKGYDKYINLCDKYKDEFYLMRSNSVHGNYPIVRQNNISNSDLQEMQELAHFVLCSIVRVYKVVNWQSYREAKRWFENQP